MDGLHPKEVKMCVKVDWVKSRGYLYCIVPEVTAPPLQDAERYLKRKVAKCR